MNSHAEHGKSLHWKEVAMSAKRHVVHLTEEERAGLCALLKAGQAKARKIARTHILLLADENKTDGEIAQAVHVGLSTVARTRERFVEGGVAWALTERPRKGAARTLDGKAEAFLIALACSNAPDGRQRWTMQLLADRLVEVGLVEEISDETVRRTLKRGR
jgi:transposase